MRLWTCVDHEGYWPTGVASVVIANTEGEARALLSAALREKSLDDQVFTLQEVDLARTGAYVLNDGNH